jgi:hypothetical protein
MIRAFRVRRISEQGSTPWLLVLPLLAVLVGPVAANPIPDSAVFTHVQPPNPTFCDRVSTMDCEQIVQYTEAIGQLEFDIFLWPVFYTGEEVEALQFTATWPTSWGFVEGSLCNGAEGSINVQGNLAAVSASWLPECPTMGTDAFLVARIVLDVTGHGEFTYRYDLGCGVTWGCNEYPPFPLGALVGAEAGIECDYCYTDCGFQMTCHPQLSPATLDVDVPQGLSDQYTIQATVYSYEYPCTPSFSGTESWMSLAVEQIDWDIYSLTLTVDTQGMELGEYSGWVIGQDDCRGCTRVNLTVTSSQGIAEPGDEAAPPGDATTWGQIKTLYR